MRTNKILINMNYLLLFTDVLLKARVHNGASSSQMTRTDRTVKSRLELTCRRVGDNVAVPVPLG